MRETARQLAYVTRPNEFDAAVDFWLETMGVGPFYLMDFCLDEQTFRGQPTVATGRAALSMHGAVQIELICATNDEPSPFTEWIEHVGRVPPGGLFHHFLIDTDDYQQTCQRLLASGLSDGFTGRLADGRPLAYLDGRDLVGSYVEVIGATATSRANVQAMREACDAWDGSAPRRDYSEL